MCVPLDTQVSAAMTKTLVILILATMEAVARGKEIISNVLVEKGIQENSAKWLIAVCQILVSMEAHVGPKKEGLSAHVLQTTWGHCVTKENRVIQTHVTMQESAFQLQRDLFADVQLDIEERLAQRKMNVNQTPVKMEANA